MLEATTEQPAQLESVFAIAVKHCPPKAIGTRALFQLLDQFQPDQQCDESLRQANGEFIGGSEVRTALKILAHYLSPIHPAVIQAAHDLREELRK